MESKRNVDSKEKMILEGKKVNDAKLQPLNLYAESVVALKGMDKCIHIFNDTDSHLLRITGADTDKEKEQAKEHIAKHNTMNVPFHFE